MVALDARGEPQWLDFDGDARVGMGTTSLLERLDVAGRVRAQLGLRFGDGTLQTTAGTRDWTQLLYLPAGFADGVDDDTTYGAGAGLSLSGTTFSPSSSVVTSSQLANGAVTMTKLANDAVGEARSSTAR